MARLIDADELMWHKSSLVEPRDKTVSMGKPISDDEVYAYRLGWNDAIDAIMDCAPTADAVEVVRCKDCVYYEMLNNNEHYCDAIYRNLSGDDEGVDFEPPEDHFCAYGKRREADETD
jgi:hypothetical protein